MKVLYINMTEQVSGGETSLFYYLKALKGKIIPIGVSPKKGIWSKKLTSAGIKNYVFSLNLLSKKNPFPFLASLSRLIRLIYKENIDILHANGLAANQLASIASLITRKPVVLHLQNFVEKPYNSIYFLSYANKIVGPSEVIINSAKKLLNSSNRKSARKNEKISLLYHAVPLSPLSKKNYSLHKELGIPKTTTIVALIGLLEKRKGHEYFIKAAQKIKGKCHFVIIGGSLFTDHSYEKRMKQLVKNLKLSTVTFLGYRTDVAQLLPDIDIVAVPSLNEPLGLIVLEAGVAGLPVVGFKSGGIREMIDDKKNGLLVKEKDSKELAQKIQLLVSNASLRKKLGSQARKRIQKDFNIKTNAGKLLKIYKELK